MAKSEIYKKLGELAENMEFWLKLDTKTVYLMNGMSKDELLRKIINKMQEELDQNQEVEE